MNNTISTSGIVNKPIDLGPLNQTKHKTSLGFISFFAGTILQFAKYFINFATTILKSRTITIDTHTKPAQFADFQKKANQNTLNESIQNEPSFKEKSNLDELPKKQIIVKLNEKREELKDIGSLKLNFIKLIEAEAELPQQNKDLIKELINNLDMEALTCLAGISKGSQLNSLKLSLLEEIVANDTNHTKLSSIVNNMSPQDTYDLLKLPKDAIIAKLNKM